MSDTLPSSNCKIHGLTTDVYKMGKYYRCKTCCFGSQKKFRDSLGKKEFKKSNWNHSKMQKELLNKPVIENHTNIPDKVSGKKPVYTNSKGGTGDLNSYGGTYTNISWNGWDF